MYLITVNYSLTQNYNVSFMHTVNLNKSASNINYEKFYYAMPICSVHIKCVLIINEIVDICLYHNYRQSICALKTATLSNISLGFFNVRKVYFIVVFIYHRETGNIFLKFYVFKWMKYFFKYNFIVIYYKSNF